MDTLIKSSDEKDPKPFVLGKRLSKDNLKLYNQYLDNQEASEVSHKNE